jgi:hypothetical protein
MDRDVLEAGRPGLDGLPARLASILVDSGYLEGLHLKAQGCLSSDLLEFIHDSGYAFEIEATPIGAFKLPFIDNELSIKRKTLNEFMEKAWLVYHGALLSAYTLKPLRFERMPFTKGLANGFANGMANGMAEGLEEVVRVREALPDGDAQAASLGADTVHHVNNSLFGIASYVSLILEERKQDQDLREKLELILEAAKRASALLPGGA